MKLIYLLPFLLVLLQSCDKTDESLINDSEEISFVVASSLEVPNDGIFNEYVNITGKDMVLDSLSFSFDEKTVYQKYQDNEGSIYISIPRSLESVTSSLKIFQKVRGKDSLISNTPFNLKAPIISGVKKDVTTFEEEVTIYGDNFDINDYTEVYVNDIQTEIIYSTKDSINFIVPYNLDRKELTIKVNSQLQEAVLSNSLVLENPEILEIQDEVNITETVIIKGKNFNRSKDYSKVILNNEIEARIEYIYNSDSLQIKIPLGPFKEFTINSLKYVTAGMEAEVSHPIEINSNYILYAKNNPFNIYQTLKYNNNIFSIGCEDQQAFPCEMFIWRFDIEAQIWVKHVEDSISGSDYTINISKDGFIYVYLPNQEDNFIRVDLENKSIEKLRSFPGTERVYPILICSSNKIFLGKGGTFEIYPSQGRFNDVYSYNIESNTWTEEEVLENEELLGANMFLDINGENFIRAQRYKHPEDNYSSENALIKFDEVNVEFRREIQTSCGPCNSGHIFEHNNKLFTGAYSYSTRKFFITDYHNQNISEILHSSFFYTSPREYFSLGDYIFFYSNVVNFYGATDGLWVLNPKYTKGL